MALWFHLRVNAETIGTVEIQRREILDLSDRAALAETWSTYDVRRDGVLVGQVRHCYGHGSWKLLAAAADLLAAGEQDARFQVEAISPYSGPADISLRCTGCVRWAVHIDGVIPLPDLNRRAAVHLAECSAGAAGRPGAAG